MSANTVFSREPLTVGSVVRETFRIYFGQFSRVLPILAVGLAPLLVVIAALASRPGFSASLDTSAGLLLFQVPVGLLTSLLSSFTTAALTHGVFQLEQRGEMVVADCLRTGFERLGMVLLIGFAVGLATGMGAMACIIPGFMIAAANAVAVPVVVVERQSFSDSLQRSWDLTRGSRGMIVGVFCVLGALQILLVLLVYAVSRDKAVQQIVSQLESAVAGGLFGVTRAVLYYGLRSSRESIGVEEIAAVFE